MVSTHEQQTTFGTRRTTALCLLVLYGTQANARMSIRSSVKEVCGTVITDTPNKQGRVHDQYKRRRRAEIYDKFLLILNKRKSYLVYLGPTSSKTVKTLSFHTSTLY